MGFWHRENAKIVVHFYSVDFFRTLMINTTMLLDTKYIYMINIFLRTNFGPTVNKQISFLFVFVKIKYTKFLSKLIRFKQFFFYFWPPFQFVTLFVFVWRMWASIKLKS